MAIVYATRETIHSFSDHDDDNERHTNLVSLSEMIACREGGGEQIGLQASTRKSKRKTSVETIDERDNNNYQQKRKSRRAQSPSLLFAQPLVEPKCRPERQKRHRIASPGQMREQQVRI